MRYLLSIIFFAIAPWAGAQKLPPFQPEQDACGALKLCNGYFFTPFSYDAGGRVVGETYGTNGWVGGFENNAVWLKVRIAAAGRIVFAISPVNEQDDYDFSLFDVTGLQCPYDVQALTDARIRYNLNCNGNCPDRDRELSHPGGLTGLDYLAADSVTEKGIFGYAFNKYIDAEAGDEYLIMVDNYTSSASGFAIDFAGSTALFENNSQPITVDSIITDCVSGYTKMFAVLSQPVLCKSIAADGSDFALSPSGITVVAASSIDCIGQEAAYTRQLVLTLDGPLVVGQQLSLLLQKGSDGNTLLDLCGNAQLAGIAKSFEVRPPLKVDAGSDTAVCAGGNIQLNAGLDGTSPGRVKWQPVTFLNTGNIENPVATPSQDITYVLLVAPVGYPAVCQYRDTIRIKVLKGFDIITPDTTLCRPSAVPLSVTGDKEFTYNWSPADYLTGTTGMLQNAVPEKPVTYTVKATYPGCKDSVQKINITIREWPNLITADTIVCQGQTVPLQVVGSGNFSYTWSPALYLSDALIITPVATPNSNITYTLTTSFPGCADSVQSVSIALEPLPDIAPMTLKTLCVGSTMQLFPSVAPAGYTNYKYQWEPAEPFNNATAKNAIYIATSTGTISLKVSTPQGCADTLSQLVSVSPLPVVHAGKDVTIVKGQTITLQGLADQPTATIKWTPAQYLSSDTVLTPIVNLPASQNFVLSIYNEYGCMATDSVFITVLKNIHIPNAFSPNGDGANDVWNILGLSSFQNSKTQVFNRWGQIVFESTGYNKPWDGTFKGGQLPIGVYYYLVTHNANGYDTFKGSVTLIR